jgi:hypothetical protein
MQAYLAARATTPMLPVPIEGCMKDLLCVRMLLYTCPHTTILDQIPLQQSMQQLQQRMQHIRVLTLLY